MKIKSEDFEVKKSQIPGSGKGLYAKRDFKKGERIRYLFEFNANIGPGHYTIALALHTKDTHLENNYEWRDQALLFEVVNNQQDEFVGTAWLKPSLKILL